MRFWPVGATVNCVRFQAETLSEISVFGSLGIARVWIKQPLPLGKTA